MITVLGAGGFIGSNLVNKLRADRIPFYAPGRDEDLRGKDLGDVIYCIGMTADFRIKPFDTVEAHVCKLSSVLQAGSFDSLIYLSSTRVYLKSKTDRSFLEEDDDVTLNGLDPYDLFGASKITGELLALNSGRENIKIVRLSNVFGADLLSENFISAVIKEALTQKKVELFTTPDSAKDYISVADVCEGLIKLADLRKSGIYNLTYGSNTTNSEILNVIATITNAAVVYSPDAQQIIFREIRNFKLKADIGFTPRESILNSLPELVAAYKI